MEIIGETVIDHDDFEGSSLQVSFLRLCQYVYRDSA